MNNLLEQAIEIPITQYIELENPIFIGSLNLLYIFLYKGTITYSGYFE